MIIRPYVRRHPKNLRTCLKMSVGLVLLLVTACSTASTEKSESEASATSASEIEINYVRGHGQHRFIIAEKEGKVRATSFRDRELVKSRWINADKYRDFLSRMEDFVERDSTTVREPASVCRNRYLIKLRSAERIRQASGCRISDETGVQLGQLLLEADFLISSN